MVIYFAIYTPPNVITITTTTTIQPHPRWSKHFMTAFAAVLLPTCFVSRYLHILVFAFVSQLCLDSCHPLFLLAPSGALIAIPTY